MCELWTGALSLRRRTPLVNIPRLLVWIASCNLCSSEACQAIIAATTFLLPGNLSSLLHAGLKTQRAYLCLPGCDSSLFGAGESRCALCVEWQPPLEGTGWCLMKGSLGSPGIGDVLTDLRTPMNWRCQCSTTASDEASPMSCFYLIEGLLRCAAKCATWPLLDTPPVPFSHHPATSSLH